MTVLTTHMDSTDYDHQDNGVLDLDRYDNTTNPNGGDGLGTRSRGLRARGDTLSGGNGASVDGLDHVNNPTGQEGVQRLHGEQAPPLDPTGEVDVMNDLSSNQHQQRVSLM